jgi:phage terminase small subunit
VSFANYTPDYQRQYKSCLFLFTRDEVKTLTNKQKVFVNEYLKDLNATRAYKTAYKNIKSEETAATNGSKLLRNTKVAQEIQKRMDERAKRTEITQDKVLKEIARLAFTDITSIVSVKKFKINIGEYSKVVIKDFSELTEDQRACISGVKETKLGIEVSFCSKERALELLGRHLGMFNDKLQLSGEVKTGNPFAGLTTEELKEIIKNEK